MTLDDHVPIDWCNTCQEIQNHEGGHCPLCHHVLTPRPTVKRDEELAEELGPLPKLHPKEIVCSRAEDELFQTITTWRRKWRKDGLTSTEELQIIQNVLSSQVGQALKYAIRMERHGTTDKPGGVV